MYIESIRDEWIYYKNLVHMVSGQSNDIQHSVNFSNSLLDFSEQRSWVSLSINFQVEQGPIKKRELEPAPCVNGEMGAHS